MWVRSRMNNCKGHSDKEVGIDHMHGGPPGKKPLVGFDEFLYLLKATRKMTNPTEQKGETTNKNSSYTFLYMWLHPSFVKT